MHRRRSAPITVLFGAALPAALVFASVVRAAAQAPPATASGPRPTDASKTPAGSAAPPAPPTAQQKTEEYYKNIQVLKGFPADQLIPSMQFISNALGVECEYCHVERAFEKDDKKEKLTARKMITMTLAINHDSFEGKREVTCNSCHRGAARPVSVPAVQTTDRAPEAPAPRSAEGPHAAEAPKAPETPAAASILDKYLQAVGGAEALQKISSRVQKGSLIGFGDKPLPVEIYAEAPNKRLSVVHTPRGDSITAFDGRAGWLGGGERPPHDMSAAESESARLDAEFHFAARVKEMFEEFRVAPPETIDGRQTIEVTAMNEGKPPVNLWFDAESGLLVRLVRYVETPLGRNPTEIDYSDYRDAGGIKIPFRWTVARPSGRFTIQVEETLQNVPIEAARFEKAPGS